MTLRDLLSDALSDRYALERELGEGGMATVWLARDEKHGRRVAIKVLKPELAHEASADRFVREIEIAGRLNHPHILAMHDSGQAAGLLYYVMPYVEGESLRDRVEREGQLSIEDAVRITAEVGGALQYAHEQGVVHRDIKPGNILLTPGGAVVSDFGIAHALEQAGAERLTQTGVAIGTPAYMSPEQGDSSRTLDGRADQYSLACVLYEMLVGQPPFPGPTVQVILAGHAAAPVPPLRALRRTLPVALEAAVFRALAKVPADRYPTTGDFAAAISTPEARTLDPAALGTPPEGVTAGRGRPRPASIMGIFAALAALAGVTYLISTGLDGGGTGVETDPGLVAVLPFIDETEDSQAAALGRMAASRVAEGASAVDWLTVVPSADVDRAVAEVGRSADRIAEATGAGWVVSGIVYRIEGELRFEAELVASDGTVTSTLQPGDTEISTEGTVEDLAQRILGQLAYQVFQDQYDLLTAPRTLDAFQALRDGLHTLNDDLDIPGAGEHFERALEADSLFLDAALGLELVAWNEGRFERSDSISRAVNRSRDRLTDYGRAVLDMKLQQTPASRYRQLQNMYALRASPMNAYNTAMYALYVNRPGDATDLVPEAVASRMSAPAHMVGTIALHRLQLHDAEASLARSGRAKHAGDSWETFMQGRLPVALAAQGDPELAFTALREIDRMPSVVFPPACAYWEVGLELRAHGHAREAEEALDRAIDWLERHADDAVEIWCDLDDIGPVVRARTLYDGGRMREASLALESIPDSTSFDFWKKTTRAKVIARRGDPEQAERMYHDLAIEVESYPWANERYYLASLAALLGRRDEAIELLREATVRIRRHKSRFWSIEHELHRDIDFEGVRYTEPFVGFLQPADAPYSGANGA